VLVSLAMRAPEAGLPALSGWLRIPAGADGAPPGAPMYCALDPYTQVIYITSLLTSLSAVE